MLPDLHTALSFEKQKYDLLCKKVNDLIDAEIKYRRNKDQRLHNGLCNLEKEVLKLVNPAKVNQATIDWQAK